MTEGSFPRMAPWPVHLALGGMAALLVFIGLTQTGYCALGYSLLFYGVAIAATAANVALMAWLRTAVGLTVVAAVLLILGFAALSASPFICPL